ncbi:uncharacterized protein LAESUDRAFT_30175 [Laetiporus sulphureus 93-53]|uniref:Zn(2)-C6 fungal-type domain-containing protein n=1 Tax=Laetiporus sulphureus 93-53 TaxID=1314785 RepID=A0A165IIA1_9APHY|nr:uncharacterized protein LAESUDRAFT_30175 [Laetiporus sulphureus 93-53]KZT13112.1 hypothetical protein LAESUDRAFT_30175 [Laetiporus sulphureus 93-53]
MDYASNSKAEDKAVARATKVRRMHSPTAGSAERPKGDPPVSNGYAGLKRARKAINCEPCRASKLKCDRNRPCSSCVLRGMCHGLTLRSHGDLRIRTTALCYQGQEGSPSRIQDIRRQVDPLGEIIRIRDSLALLELHCKDTGGSRSTSTNPANSSGFPPHPIATPSKRLFESMADPPSRSSASTPLGNTAKAADPNIISTPGKHGQHNSGGLYEGPTTVTSNLINTSDKDESDASEHPPTPSRELETALSPSSTVSATLASAYDEDLIAALPPINTVDEMVAYYFSYCNWIYRHVNEPALLDGWACYKEGQSGDRVVFATVCVLIALAVCYLPPGHALLAGLGASEQLAQKYNGLSQTALQRYRADAESRTRTYTLGLVELLLAQSHYMTFAKEGPEEVWALGSELVSVGMAMGLHRDPGKHRYERTLAERRRWAWWHILLFERWQAFMFGRPLQIASHHFDTHLPTFCDSALDPSGQVYIPNLVLFRLAYILGDIMDDAVSFRPVPYAAVQERDRMLKAWYDALPRELLLDEFALARGLTSVDSDLRRLAVQSVIHRCAYFHIRFTLHRPYVKLPESLEIAVSAASGLISLFAQAFNVACVPGHLNWGPFHVFSALMFFSFQLINSPNQPGKGLFREQIRKGMVLLDQCRVLPVADKALMILQALEPLYAPGSEKESPEERSKRKAQILKLVKNLAFPYQDLAYSRDVESPGYRPFSPRVAESAMASRNDVQMQMEGSPALHVQVHDHTVISTASMQWPPVQTEDDVSPPYMHPPPESPLAVPQQMMKRRRTASETHQQLLNMQKSLAADPVPSNRIGHPPRPQPPPGHAPAPSPYSRPTMNSYAVQQATMMQQPQPHHVQAFDGGQPTGYLHPADESSMWGASVGFGLGEWAQFLNVVHRPDAPTRHSHMERHPGS